MLTKIESGIIKTSLVVLAFYSFVPWIISKLPDLYTVKADFNGATIQTISEGLTRNVSEVRVSLAAFY